MRVIVLIFFVGLWGCNEIEDCALNPYSDLLSISMTPINSGNTIRFDSIVVQKIGKIDSIDNAVSLTNLKIPLSPRDTSLYVTFYTDTASYFFGLGYQVQSLIYELDCEVAIRYHGLHIETQNIPEINLTASEIDNRFFTNHVSLRF